MRCNPMEGGREGLRSGLRKSGCSRKEFLSRAGSSGHLFSKSKVVHLLSPLPCFQSKLKFISIASTPNGLISIFDN